MTATQYSWIKYPKQAGFKRDGTSKLAAERITTSGRLHTLREKAFELLKATPDGLTPDEIAAAINEDILAVRPRLSELKVQGRVRESGSTRINERSGQKAAVLVVV